MSVDIVNYIKKSINTYNPDINVADGSAIADFAINPISIILEPYNNMYQEILNDLVTSNPDEISKNRLDNIAGNFLLTRITGTKAYGEIFFIFNTARNLVIPKYTTLISQYGFRYETVSDYSISKTQMENDFFQYPYYTTGPISIYAVEVGSEYQIESTSTFTLESPLSFTPVKIVSTDPILNGSDEETNAELLSRIKRTIYGRSLASPTSIKSLINEIDTSVSEVEVVGANDDLMIRDILYSVDDLNSYIKEDFRYCRQDDHILPNKEHISYTGVFIDSDPSSEVGFPSLESWSTELTDDQYKGIARKDDPLYTEENQHILVNQFDTTTNILDTNLALVIESGQWELNDSFNPDQSIDPSEFGLDGGKLRLGGTIDPTLSIANVKIPFIDFQTNLDRLIANVGINNSVVSKIAAYLQNFTTSEKMNNQSPVIHKQIDQHLGIEVTCTMSTTDGTESGEMSYITVLRNNKVFLPHDGYGLAWRKQPEYLIRMQYNAYDTDDERSADVAKFYSEYGSQLTHDPEWYLGKIKDYPDLWKYNVYLVDNDVLQEETWVGIEQIWDQTSGKNQFLVAGKVWIEANRNYNVIIKFYNYLGFDAWVYDESDEAFVVNDSSKCLTRGQTYPTYVPQSGDKLTASNGVEELDYYRNHFGIAVGETKNYEWYYSNIKVWSFIEAFPMHLFKFKIDSSTVDINSGINIEYYGIGYDPTRSITNPSEDNSRVKLGIYNFTTSEWETLGYNDTPFVEDAAIIMDTILISGNIDPITDYLDENNYINIAATAANSGLVYNNDNSLLYDFTNNIEHAIRTYYISIDNGGFQGIHRGNATDIYVHDPTNIITGSTVIQMTGNNILTNNLPNINKYIQEIVEIREYISQTAISKSSYVINVKNEGTVYSSNPSYEIIFDLDNLEGTLIEIVYRYWSRGEYFNSIINDDKYRFPSADYMLKIMPPTIITINTLEYSGSVDEVTMKTYIKDFFNSLTDLTFDKSDLVNFMYTKGANYVNLDMEIFIKSYTSRGKYSLITLDGQTYTITGTLSRFFTDINELYGVTKV